MQPVFHCEHQIISSCAETVQIRSRRVCSNWVSEYIPSLLVVFLLSCDVLPLLLLLVFAYQRKEAQFPMSEKCDMQFSLEFWRVFQL